LKSKTTIQKKPNKSQPVLLFKVRLQLDGSSPSYGADPSGDVSFAILLIEDWSFGSLEGTQKERDQLIKKFAGCGGRVTSLQKPICNKIVRLASDTEGTVLREYESHGSTLPAMMRTMLAKNRRSPPV